MSVSAPKRSEITKSLNHLESQITKSKKCNPADLSSLYSKIQSTPDNKEFSKNFQKLAEKGITLTLSKVQKRDKKGKSQDLDLIFSLVDSVKLIENQKTQKNLSAQIQKIVDKQFPSNTPSTSTSKDFWAVVDSDSLRPIVGKVIEISELTKEYKQDNLDVKPGLDQLHPFFNMRRVAGDGHCLFRSTLIGLVHYLKQATQKDVLRFYEQLHTSVDQLKDVVPGIEKKYKLASEHIKDMIAGKKSIEDIFNHRSSSDLLVSFLRDLVCAHNFIHGDEVFDAETVVFSGNQEKYLADMMDMSKKELGGHPEVLALNNILGIEIIPINVTTIANGIETPEHYLDKALQAKKSPIFLLLRPGHYDIAFPKV